MNRVYQILERQVPQYLLKGYTADVLDADAGRFYAYTFNRLGPEDHETASTLNLYFTSGNGCWGVDDEKSRIYMDNGRTYRHKDTEQCIKDGLYHAYAAKFYGCLYEGWWYIMKELTYFGEHMPEKEAHELLTAKGDLNSILEYGIYLPIGSHFPSYQPGVEGMRRGVEYLEFVGEPELVAYSKQEKKSAQCRAFTHFMNQDIFLPFKDRLRVARFEAFSDLIPLYSNDFIMIYPKTREFILIPAMVKDIQDTYRLCYFFWHARNRKMYEWTYFEPETSTFGYHYSESIIENLSKISGWNEIGYLNSSCTLDDKGFWDTYVLQMENGKYAYLKELL
jgi:hypothetical protein